MLVNFERVVFGIVVVVVVCLRLVAKPKKKIPPVMVIVLRWLRLKKRGQPRATFVVPCCVYAGNGRVGRARGVV